MVRKMQYLLMEGSFPTFQSPPREIKLKKPNISLKDAHIEEWQYRANGSPLSWISAEDTFLEACASIQTVSNVGYLYQSEEMSHRKLNFIRIFGAANTDAIYSAMNRHFPTRDENSAIRIPRRFTNILNVDPRFQLVGTPIIHMKFKLDPNQSHRDLKDYDLVRFKRGSLYKHWEYIHEECRERLIPNGFASFYEKIFKSGIHDYYLLKKKNVPVACFALTWFEKNKANLWGVSTLSSEMRQGHQKRSMDSLANLFPEAIIYLQTNENSSGHKLFRNFKNYCELATEDTYNAI